MLIALWSVAGGPGVTVTVLLTALHLRNETRESVLVVDLDGDLPTAAGVGSAPPDAPDAGIADWSRLGADARPDALDRLIRPIASGIDLLPRGSGPIDAGRLPLLAQLLRSRAGPVIVDVGRVHDGDGARPVPFLRSVDRSVLVMRCCYLALRRACRRREVIDGIVTVLEAGRVLTPREVGGVVERPVLAEIPVDPAVARVVDAGLILRRPPRFGERLTRLIPGPEMVRS